MTPAINLLKKLKIDFTLHHYSHDANTHQFGQEAITKLAAKLNIEHNRIFKTLVISINNDIKSLAVCVLPVPLMLDFRKVAQSLKCKKAELADMHIAQKTTGYIIGGISPLGQKKTLPTLIDNNATQCSSIFISGGRRGIEIEINPHTLAKTLKATFFDLAE